MAYNSNDIPKPEQEPVARIVEHGATVKLDWANADAAHNAKVGSLYTTPPQRTWVGLTDAEKSELWEVSRAALPRYATYASLVEAKLKGKNA